MLLDTNTAKALLSIRKIAADSLLTIVPLFLSYSTGTVAHPVKSESVLV